MVPMRLPSRGRSVAFGIGFILGLGAMAQRLLDVPSRRR